MSKDFHGGRTYAADSPQAVPGIGFSLGLALTWLKLRLADLLGVGHAAPDDPSPESPPGRPPFQPANDAESDAELRLVSMFQVFDGPGNTATRFGEPRATQRRQTETQDR
jgi:hypothetical protein